MQFNFGNIKTFDHAVISYFVNMNCDSFDFG